MEAGMSKSAEPMSHFESQGQQVAVEDRKNGVQFFGQEKGDVLV